MKKFLSIFSLIFLGSLTAVSVKAVCPVCTMGAVVGVGLGRWLGLDDLITGAWLGGLLLSSLLWFWYWLVKKKPAAKQFGWLIAVAWYAMAILPLYFMKIIGHPYNKLWGIDKLLFGIVSGTLVFSLAVWFNNYLKRKNQGKVYFPYQKVVVPISFLAVASVALYFLSKCK
ncbi:MAG: hypothetical protein AAB723_03125 [Patescibacteria group bacterium]